MRLMFNSADDQLVFFLRDVARLQHPPANRKENKGRGCVTRIEMKRTYFYSVANFITPG